MHARRWMLAVIMLASLGLAALEVVILRGTPALPVTRQLLFK